MTPETSACRRFCWVVVCCRCSFLRVLLVLALLLTGIQMLHIILVSRLETRQDNVSGFPHREGHDTLYKSVIMAIKSSQVIVFNCSIIGIQRWMLYCIAGNEIVDRMRLQHRRQSQQAEMLLDQSVMWLRKATDWWCDSAVEFLSNDYTNPNTNPKTLTTLALTLADHHGAFESFCAPVFRDFVQNYSCTVDGAVVTS